MKSREAVDPELHVLRTIGRALDGRERQELESARFHLYAAFEASDADSARRWAIATRAVLLALRKTTGGEEAALMKLGLEVLETIEQAIAP